MSANVGGLIISPTLPDINSLRIDDYDTTRLQIISLVLEEKQKYVKELFCSLHSRQPTSTKTSIFVA
jgi:hypothetical protein